MHQNLRWFLDRKKTKALRQASVLVIVYWTERSTNQGVVARANSESDEREAQGRFEVISTITLRIVRHEVQLLINRIYNKFRDKNENFFRAKTSVALLLSFENYRKHCEGSH